MVSQQKRVLIAALVVLAILVVIAAKINKPLPSTPAPAPSEPTLAQRPPTESAAQPDKPAEQPTSKPQAAAAPATEKPEPSVRLDTVEEAAPPEESKPTPLPRFVEVGADKCIPCKMMQPILDELRDKYADKLQVDFVDVWVHPKQADKYGIRSIPTQVIYDSSGEEVFRHFGFWPKDEILAKFKELGIDLDA